MGTLSVRNDQKYLPQYLLTATGSLAEDFESLTGWSTALGTLEVNTTAGQFRTGSASLKLSTPAGSGGLTTKTVNIPGMTYGSIAHVRLWVYLHSALVDYSTITLYLGNADFSKDVYCGKEVQSKNFKLGWNCIDFYNSEWSRDTAYLTDSDTIERIRLVVVPRTANAVVVSFDSLYFGLAGLPSALISFDDWKLSVYSKAYDYMKTKSAVGTFYVNSGSVDGVGYVTHEQLQEMYAAGWCIGNHTRSHTTLTGITQEEAETALNDCRVDLDAWGITTGNHVAYPGGFSDETVRAALAAQSMLTGRANWNPVTPVVVSENMYTFGTIFPASTTSLATVQGYIDNAYNDNRIIALGFHEIVDGTPETNEWKTSDFQAMIDYLVSLHFSFITAKDYYDLLASEVRTAII